MASRLRSQSLNSGLSTSQTSASPPFAKSIELATADPEQCFLAGPQRRRDPIQVKKVPAKTPAANTVPIACNGLCLTMCSASSIASSAAWRPCLIAWLADRTPSSTASVTLDLILDTSRRGFATVAGFSNIFANIRFAPSRIPIQATPECKSLAKRRVALFSSRCPQRNEERKTLLGRYRKNLRYQI